MDYQLFTWGLPTCAEWIILNEFCLSTFDGQSGAAGKVNMNNQAGRFYFMYSLFVFQKNIHKEYSHIWYMVPKYFCFFVNEH